MVCRIDMSSIDLGGMQGRYGAAVQQPGLRIIRLIRVPKPFQNRVTISLTSDTVEALLRTLSKGFGSLLEESESYVPMLAWMFFLRWQDDGLVWEFAEWRISLFVTHQSNGCTLFPTIVEVHKGFPKRKVVFQSSPVNFHDCWREGKSLQLGLTI